MERIKEICSDVKNWLEWFIEIDFLLTPLAIEKFLLPDDDDFVNDSVYSFGIFIFGFRIFTWKRW